jgi:hypothetical protein
MIPVNEWWAVLQNYNQTIFPAQIIFYLLAVAVLILFNRGDEKVANRVVKGFFVLAFAWIGIMFFLVLGQNLPAHNIQAILFLSLSVLFAVDLFTDTTRFSIPPTPLRRILTLAGFGLILAYPLVSILLGRPPAKWIIPGTFPCPTTALVLIFMATTFPTRRRWLYTITLGLLLIWAVPFPIMIQIPKFGVYEDSIMLAAGIYSLIVYVIYWVKITRKRKTLPIKSVEVV